jgi:hypothetical protein
MILFADYTKNLLDGNTLQSHSIIILTAIFFMLTFLAATQDIAVDGWVKTLTNLYCYSFIYNQV